MDASTLKVRIADALRSMQRSSSVASERSVSTDMPPVPTEAAIPAPPLPPPPPRGPARYGRVDHPGGLTIRHFPVRMCVCCILVLTTAVPSQAQHDGGLHLALVLERRYAEPPHLPTLNKWQHRQCAQCMTTQSTGMFGTKAHYCHYTELLYCTECFGAETRAIPWRVVQSLDMKPRPVSIIAADFLDTMWRLPLITMSAVSPRQFTRRRALQEMTEYRERLVELVVRVCVRACVYVCVCIWSCVVWCGVVWWCGREFG